MNVERVEWLIRKYAEGTATEEEREQLLTWYRSAPIKDVHWVSSGPEEKTNLHDRMLKQLLNQVSVRKTRIIRMPVLKIAASVLILIGAAIIAFFVLGPSSDKYITVDNSTGKIELIRLPDNSSVWLNASGSIRYSKSFKENRELFLSGEAYFEVVHDPAHPFTINSDDIKTTVLGTAFTIKAYESDNYISVTLLSGKVKVTNQWHNPSFLKPSEQLQYNKASHQVNTVMIDTIAVIAWQKGKLQFSGQTLEEISKTLERWYGYTFEFNNQHIKSCRYYLNFNNSISIQKLLTMLAETADLSYEIDEERKIIKLSGEKCQ